jgi:hypothetical protein
MKKSGPGGLKLGGRILIRSQGRQIIFSVYSSTKMEAEKQLQENVSLMCGVSCSSVRGSVVLDEKKGDSQEQFSLPRRNSLRKEHKSDLEDIGKCVIRLSLNELHPSSNKTGVKYLTKRCVGLSCFLNK